MKATGQEKTPQREETLSKPGFQEEKLNSEAMLSFMFSLEIPTTVCSLWTGLKKSNFAEAGNRMSKKTKQQPTNNNSNVATADMAFAYG